MRPLDYEDLYRIPLPSDPQLAPDGSSVAYVRTVADRETDGYRSEIWLASVGDPPRRLTTGPADGAPRWSPDGRTLAFCSRRDGVPQLWLLPMGGGEARELTKLAGGVAEACWSPDGQELAVLATVDLAGDAEGEA
ncbi:MAG: TolB family protein, partial [Mycobacteriales bacterium]